MGLRDSLAQFQSYLLSNDSELRPFKPWQLANLGMQASQLVMDAFEKGEGKEKHEADSPRAKLERGLRTLRDISQNLPIFAGWVDGLVQSRFTLLTGSIFLMFYGGQCTML